MTENQAVYVKLTESQLHEMMQNVAKDAISKFIAASTDLGRREAQSTQVSAPKISLPDDTYLPVGTLKSNVSRHGRIYVAGSTVYGSNKNGMKYLVAIESGNAKIGSNLVNLTGKPVADVVETATTNAELVKSTPSPSDGKIQIAGNVLVHRIERDWTWLYFMSRVDKNSELRSKLDALSAKFSRRRTDRQIYGCTSAFSIRTKLPLADVVKALS